MLRKLRRFCEVRTLSSAASTDLNRLARQAVEGSGANGEGAACSGGGRVRVVTELGDIPHAAGQPLALVEVLSILLANSIEALRAGGDVTIKTWASEGAVHCEVGDSGIGMSEDVRRRAMEPFFTTKGPARNGLGLSVAYAVIQRHQGEIEIASLEGEGTRVTLRLPPGAGAPDGARQGGRRLQSHLTSPPGVGCDRSQTLAGEESELADGSRRGAPFERDGSTLRFGSGSARTTVSICTPRIVRVDLAGEDRAAGPSHLEPREWAPASFEIVSGEPLRLATTDLRIEIATDPVRLAFLDPAGTRLLHEPIDGGMSAEAGRDGVRACFAFSGEQHFYGLGQGGGGLDRLGTARQLWNTQLGHGPGSDMGVPLLLSNRGYGLFFDNTSDATVAVGRSDNGVRLVYTAAAGRLTWYFLIGADLRSVMGEVADLLGRPALPPRWALGFIQSTRHFDDTAELRALPRTIREKRIPCDGLVYLSSYGEALGWNRGVGHLEFQPELWPNPAALLDEARRQHFEVITHEYPVLHEKSPLFADAEARGYLLPEGYERAAASGRPPAAYRDGQRYIDFSDPAARTWWWAAHRELRALGVAGWWLDGGEGPPGRARLHAGNGTLLHNMYDRYRQQAFAEGEAADRPDQRVFLLCRSGAAGMQRLGAACWSGDINNDFATLEAQIPLGLNTGLSGVPYWGSDVGGFFHAVPETGELYARWFQLGAFCPVFRSHGWVWREHVPWAHGPEIEAICRRYAELRYRLLPYTYSLAWQARTLGLPLMRPLVLNYPDDPRVWQLGTEFLWGDDLLIAPVTRAGATAWPVYLPAGVWYNFWTGARHEGPGGVTLDAPLDRLPLLVRAGSIVPMGPVIQHTGLPQAEITLLIHPSPIDSRGGSATSRFELYEDDGRSNAYRDGHHALTPIECVAGPAGATVRIGEPVGDRSVIPAGRRYLIRIRIERPTAVSVAGHGALPRVAGPAEGGAAGWWLDAEGFTGIRLPPQPAAVVEISASS